MQHSLLFILTILSFYFCLHLMVVLDIVLSWILNKALLLLLLIFDYFILIFVPACLWHSQYIAHTLEYLFCWWPCIWFFWLNARKVGEMVNKVFYKFVSVLSIIQTRGSKSASVTWCNKYMKLWRAIIIYILKEHGMWKKVWYISVEFVWCHWLGIRKIIGLFGTAV